MKFLCKLFGHDFRYYEYDWIHEGWYHSETCRRCGIKEEAIESEMKGEYE